MRSKPWVKLYRGEHGSFAQLPLYVRGLAAMLLKIADDEGYIALGGRDLAGAIAWQLGATRGDRRLLKSHCPLLLADDYIRIDGDRALIKSLDRIQSETRQMREPGTSGARPGHGTVTTMRLPGDDAVTTGQRQDNQTPAKVPKSYGGTNRALKDVKEKDRDREVEVERAKVAEVHPSQERDGRPRSMCHRWAALFNLPADRITSTDLHYARQIIAACDGANEDWGDVFGRWAKDDWVKRTRQKLLNLDNNIHKYLTPADAPAMSETDRQAEVSRIGRLIGPAENDCRMDPTDTEAQDRLAGLQKVMDRLRKARAN